MNRLKKANFNKMAIFTNFFRIIHAELDDDIVTTVRSLYNLVEINIAKNMQTNVELIKDIFPNSLYNGKVYRKIAIRSENIFQGAETDMNVGTLIELCKNEVRKGEYQSTTKSIESCKEFEAISYRGDLFLIIAFDAVDAIDVQELANECEEYCLEYIEELNAKDENDEQVIDERSTIKQMIKFINTIRNYDEEQEVFALIPDTFEIYSIETKDGYIDISDLNRNLLPYELSRGKMGIRNQRVQSNRGSDITFKFTRLKK